MVKMIADVIYGISARLIKGVLIVVHGDSGLNLI